MLKISKASEQQVAAFALVKEGGGDLANKGGDEARKGSPSSSALTSMVMISVDVTASKKVLNWMRFLSC